MRDLSSYIIEQHAAQWEELGLALGLKQYHITNISKDNEYNPHRSVSCCRSMLERWLQEIPLPTWDKLDIAINKIKSQKTGLLPTVSNIPTGTAYYIQH